MSNQGPEIGRINPSFSDPPGEQNPMGQPVIGMSAYPQGPGHTGVTVQPTVFMTSTPAAAPKDYLCYSIFTMLFCCLPLGIAAIIYSVSTRDANMAGQQDLAIRSSRKALILNHVALCVGLAVNTLTPILSLHRYHFL